LYTVLRKEEEGLKSETRITKDPKVETLQKNIGENKCTWYGHVLDMYSKMIPLQMSHEHDMTFEESS
jgi:hypothetical protein